MEFSNEKENFCHCTCTIADMEHIKFFQKSQVYSPHACDGC